MKLTRYNKGGVIVPAVMKDESTVMDCSQFGEDWNELFFENDGLKRLSAFIAEKGDSLPTEALSDVTLAPATTQSTRHTYHT